MTWRKWRYLLPWVRPESERDMREELHALAEMAGPGELGNLTLAAEDARSAWGWNWLGSLLMDVRYGFRTLLSQPGFLAAAVLTVALGVGANTSIFSLINATLLRPLPFPDASRLVLLWKTYGAGTDNESIISAPDYWDIARQTRSFEGVAISILLRMATIFRPRGRNRNRLRACEYRRVSLMCLVSSRC